MRVVLQRVKQASVQIEGEETRSIERGLLILLGISHDDGMDDVRWLVQKITQLRIFSDSEGKMNEDITQVNGAFLVISQFTLHASTRKGNRPSYIRAARPEHAIPLYEEFLSFLRQESQRPVLSGTFGADMQVHLQNDGPVTIIMDSQQRE
ncbi:MAG: D-tyrosyl-tRNA(Tyr) deacylase [Saprospiraceae bacterium]|nr:D-tyrosyl-tRNA(Tyr) deacylase [Saprospiraceae bacterium]